MDPVTAVWPLLCALGVALVATPLAMWIARRVGAVAPPRADRWHKRPTPMLGGIAIFLAHTITLLVFLPMRTEVIGLLVAGTAIFVLGLVDDVRPLRPSVKLAGQLVAACLLVPFGVHAIFVIHPVIAIPATLFWIVAITNAFNLLDNMDGLSSGVAAISAGFLMVVALMTGQGEVALIAVSLAGAALGFLVYNFNPARIFMGDSGSLFLGFNLGSLAIMGTWREASNLFLVLIVPLCVLAVPLFDTTLVTLLRKLSGRAISQGGRDHSSHRLVALGLSERNAVLVLYAVCIAFGSLAIIGLWLDLFVTAVAIGVLAVLILLFGVFLGEAKVYGEQRDPDAAPPLLRRLVAHKWLLVELGADVVLVPVAYLGAYLIRFEGSVPEPVPQQIHQLLPIVLPLHVLSFALFSVYQQEWRYGGLRANWRLLQAVLVGGALSFVAVYLLTNFTFYSRAVFVIATLLVLVFAMGSRTALRVFRHLGKRRRAAGRRAVIVGAGDAAERVVLELHQHGELGLEPAALVDDNPQKRGRRVHGVPVLGQCRELSEVARTVGADEIIFAIPRARGRERRRLLELCATAGLPVQVALGARDVVQLGGARSVRPARLDDYLSRGRVELDRRAHGGWVHGRTWMLLGFSGAASLELARLASELGAREIVACDAAGPALVGNLELLGRSEVHVSGRVCDPSDEGALVRVLREVRPDVVALTTMLRSEVAVALDPACALERNFLVPAQVARACTEAGVRSLVLWSGEGASLRLGELAAASLGPAQVVALRLPVIAEDPDNPLGMALESAARDHAPPLIPTDLSLPLVLATEVAALTVAALGEEGARLLRVDVVPEPLGALLAAALRTGPGTDVSDTDGAPEVAPAPTLSAGPLPRLSSEIVLAVVQTVANALRAGRIDDAFGATTRLVPDGAPDAQGELVVLTPTPPAQGRQR